MRRNPTHRRAGRTPHPMPREKKKGGEAIDDSATAPLYANKLTCLALLDTPAHVYALCLPAVLPCPLGGIKSRKPRAVDAATSINPRRGGTILPMRWS